MKKLINLIIALSVTLFGFNVYSQISLNPDSLTIGASYKFILYDDTEIIGKISSTDSLHITVIGEKGTYRLKKEDIFFVSRELTTDKFKAILSLGGGMSILTDNSDAPYYYEESYKGKFALQLSALFPLGESKGIRLDMGYSRWVRDDYEVSYNWSNDHYYYGARSKNFYYFKADFVIGTFAPSNKFWIYGAAGFGVHFLNEGEYDYISTYYSTFDSTYHITNYYNPSHTHIAGLLSLGGAFGYRFSKHLGVYADVQLNTIAYEGFFFFFWGGSGAYIPLRAGLTYIIF